MTTIEDPVEYRLSGVQRIQVAERTGLTFATGLRAIVRADPDVAMVGEIGDRGSAHIAAPHDEGVDRTPSGQTTLTAFGRVLG